MENERETIIRKIKESKGWGISVAQLHYMTTISKYNVTMIVSRLMGAEEIECRKSGRSVLYRWKK